MQYKEGEYLVFDIETNGFIEDMVDYSSFPYKLKESARIWVVSIRDKVTGKVNTRYLEKITREWMADALKDVKVLVAHNGIEFDLPVLKLFGLIDYKVGYPGESSTVNGKECLILDSLLFSRLLDPDRFGGHSLEALGKGTGELKTDFRQVCIDKGYIEKSAPIGQEFQQFVPEMVEYCDQDTLVNSIIIDDLKKEAESGGYWKTALDMESKLADLGVARSHFGFELDVELAKKNFKELTELMIQMAEEVEPLLPPCPLNKGEINSYTPPTTQITKSGKLGTYFVRFIERTGAKLLESNGEYQVEFEGKTFNVPFEGPIKTHRAATIDDMDHIKQFLIDEHGWEPSEWRVRDLTMDSKKNKLPYDKRIQAFERWLKETMAGKYKNSRLKIVAEDYKVTSVKELYQEIAKRLKDEWPVRVPTSPPIKVGVAKDLCDNLVKLGSKVEFARSFADYLTYKDRRSNIAGGPDIDEIDIDTERPSSGYLSAYREEDSRIPTRAFTIGTNTFRYSHMGVVNIPRVTSMYGAPMRAMFTAGKGYVQLGFDFSGLESRVQSHYIHDFKGGHEEGRILRGEDGLCPHNYLAEMLGVSRDDAKSIRYACLPVDNTEVLTADGWRYHKDLKKGQKVLTYNTEKDLIEEDFIKEIPYFEDKPVVLLKNNYEQIESTSEHRWYGDKRVNRGDERFYEKMFFTTEEITTENRILRTSTYEREESILTKEEGALLGWILSDGYVKWSGHLRNKEMGVITIITQSDKKRWRDIERDLIAAGERIKKFTDTSSKTKSLNPNYGYSIDPNFTRKLFRKIGAYAVDKHDVDWEAVVLKMSSEVREVFLDRFIKGDGHTTNANSVVITQKRGNIHDGVALASYLNGENITLTDKGSGCNVILHRKNKYTGMQVMEKEILPARPTFCITTNNGTFIMRQNKKFYSITGNCTYGSSHNKIAQMMNVSKTEGKEILDGFWNASSATKAFKDYIEDYWSTVGQERNLPAIDGRLLRSRSKHSLVNAMFQSCGSIFAKNVTVNIMRLLEEQGVVINPFEGRPDMTSMQENHDECQFVIHPKYIELETFDTKEEAEEYLKSKSKEKYNYSNVSKGTKGYYVVKPNILTRAITDATIQAEKDLKLNVKMDYDWMVGRSWKDCH